MALTRSSWPAAVLLSLCTISDAWVVRRSADSSIHQEEHVAIELRQDGTHNKFNRRQNTALICPDDRYMEFLDSNPTARIKTFCNEWLGISPSTVTVEYTPTITITTSAESTTTSTSTTRVVITQTLTQTATTTLAPIVARAANIAAAVAEDIMSSVIISGTTAEPTVTKNAQRISAESGLATACSCKMVDPTATVTYSYALPATSTTVGFRILVISRVTDTRSITAFTTVTETSAVSSGSVVMASSVAASSSVPASSPIVSSSPVVVETLVDPTRISAPTTSQVSIPTLTSPSTSIVTAIPFSCPEAANNQVDQVVGNYKLDYLVYCDTEITSEDRIGRPIDTDSETTCAAQCSVVNAQSGQSTCKAAAFTPYTDGRAGGLCVLSGSGTEYASKPGSVTIVNTGISSNGDECAAFDSASRSIDTSALVASITSAGVSVSTPGLLTQTADGGVFETYVSANSTDAGGTVRFSWYRVSASSSFWWAVYATSWSCTRTIPQTVVQQPPTALPVTITTELVTTIINGATTTIISGNSTRTIVNGGGMFGPTFVPASTTSGEAGLTTFFSQATQISTAGSGIIPPTTGVSATPSLPAPSVKGSTLGSSIEIVVSGSTSTYTSTGNGGLIPPVPSASVPSGSIASDFNTTTIISAGSALFSTSGSTATRGSTGGEGLIPPASVGSSSVSAPSAGSNVTISASSSTLNSTALESIATPPPMVIVTVTVTLSGSIATTSSAGGNGEIPPSFIASSPVETVSVGSANFTIGSSTFTAGSTGGEGLIPPPSSTPVGQTAVVSRILTSTTTLTLLETPPPVIEISTSVGSAIFSTSNSTAVRSSTGGFGEIPPPSSTPLASSNVTISVGSLVFSTSGSTAVASSTGGNGEIPPPSSTPVASSNVTVSSGSLISSTSGSTATAFSTGASGVIPPPLVNSTTINSPSLVPTPSIDVSFSSGGTTFTVQGSTAVSSATGSNGIIPPSANFSMPMSTPVSATPSPSTNATVSTGSTGTNSDSPRSPFPIPSSSAPIELRSSALPFTNTTVVVVPPSATPIPTFNGTVPSSSIGTNSDAPRIPFPIPSSSVPAVESSALPFTNTTTTVTIFPSATPSLSFNGTVPSSSIGTNSDAPRIPFPILSSSVPAVESSALPFTNTTTTVTIFPSATPSPSFNGTVPSSSIGTKSDTPHIPFPIPSSSAPIVASSGTPVPSSNSSVTAIPSMTPSPSSNFTVHSSSIGTNSDAPRIPFPIPSSATLPTGNIIPSTNVTVPAVPSMTPSFSVNATISTASIGTNSDAPRLPFPIPSSTALPTSVPAPSGSIPAPSGNTTSSPPPAETIVVIVPPFGNISVPIGTSVTVTTLILPIQPANSTAPATLSSANMTSMSSMMPSGSANITESLALPTGGFNSSIIVSASPSPLQNSTAPASIPSASPTLFLNSTSPFSLPSTTPVSVCPTAPITVTEISTATSVQVVTIIQTVSAEPPSYANNIFSTRV